MIDFADEFYYNLTSTFGESDDKAIARRRAFSAVLPIIIDNELTPRQSTCFKFKYLENKTQDEIASQLKLSQPTVSRHISTAKDIVNNNLKYCYLALSKGIDEYDKLNTLC